MTDDPSAAARGSASKVPLIAAGLAFLLLGGGALWLLRPEPPQILPAPGLAEPVDAAGLNSQGFAVTVAVLGAVYEAFSQTEEAAIYDGLSAVAADEALESLYLERAGALATGGLPDQVVHELSLTEGAWRLDGDRMTADIRWAVLGQVGHSEHTHMRGNAYGAELTIAPAGDAWRLTEFRLTDVDRTEAGTLTTLAEGTADSPAGVVE